MHGEERVDRKMPSLFSHTSGVIKQNYLTGDYGPVLTGLLMTWSSSAKMTTTVAH